VASRDPAPQQSIPRLLRLEVSHPVACMQLLASEASAVPVLPVHLDLSHLAICTQLTVRSWVTLVNGDLPWSFLR